MDISERGFLGEGLYENTVYLGELREGLYSINYYEEGNSTLLASKQITVDIRNRRSVLG
jgi:hypothetical protein